MSNEPEKNELPVVDVQGSETPGNGEPDLKRHASLDNIVFALLFASDEPVSIRKIASIVEDAPGPDVKAAVERWRKRFDEEAWSVRVEQVAGGYQVATRESFAPYIGRLYSGRRKFRLSRAGLETLAIIAYKQPITRAEVENVRGVGSGGVITNLMERGLIKITGKARVLGAPFLYGSTPEFLEYLGLNALGDLPNLEELESLLEKEAYPESAVVDGEEAEEGATAVAPVPATASDESDDDVADFADVVAALDLAKRAAETSIKEKKGGSEEGETPAAESEAPPAAASVVPVGPSAEADEPAEGDAIPTIDFSEDDSEPDGSGDDDERNG